MWYNDLQRQRTNINFCVKLGKTFTETLVLMRQAYGEDAMSRAQVFEWLKRFRSGHRLTDDDPRSEDPERKK